MLLQGRNHFAIMLLPCLALRWNHKRTESALPGSRNSRSLRLIRDDDRDPRVRDTASLNAVRDGHEIRPAPGKKNAKDFHSGNIIIHHGAAESQRDEIRR